MRANRAMQPGPLYRGVRHLRSTLPCLLLLAATARAESLLLITEVVTDPQADHSENIGGNGVAFDQVPGTGTISSVDEFVEIHNPGLLPIDLAGYSLVFTDTTPSRYLFGSGARGVVLRFSAGSEPGALLPGGYLLLGNPPGALNNALEILLAGPDGSIADFVALDGNASSRLDEAVARQWNGRYLDSFSRAPITPLAPSPALPAPGTGWLLASALAAAAATRRRVRGGGGRRPS